MSGRSAPKPPHEVHRGVRMQVDEAGHDEPVQGAERRRPRSSPAHLGRRRHERDAAFPKDERVIFEDDPLGDDRQVNGPQ